MTRRPGRVVPLFLWLALGCVVEQADGGALLGDEHDDTSVHATMVDFDLSAEVVIHDFADPDQAVTRQLLYTIGHLNGDDSNGVGSLGDVEFLSFSLEDLDGDTSLVRYRVKMPVAWGHPDAVPEVHRLRLPRDMTDLGRAFTEKYGRYCVDPLAHGVDASTFWYYYRPGGSSCRLDPDDIVDITAQVTLSPKLTTGKYPEYDEVWKDGALRVVAVFAKDDSESSSNGDIGIIAYNRFSQAVEAELSGHALISEPVEVPERPGDAMPEIQYSATLARGRKVEISIFLVSKISDVDESFIQRYESFTGAADFIAYGGHSGLGRNIQALTDMGQWSSGQYSIFYVGGCDTYAYSNRELLEARNQVNPDDPAGTKYLDLVTNARPVWLIENPNTSMAFIRALMNPEQPKTYEQILAQVDPSQVIVVTGEEDNVFSP